MRSLAIALITLTAAGVHAQRFSAAASEARDLPTEVARFGAAFFTDCAGDRACERTARRDARALRRPKWLVSVPASGHVELGPYESVREGFLVRVPTVVLPLDGGRASTHAPQADGRFPREVLGENFIAVPPGHAERWLARNATSRLRLRMVVRFEGAFEGTPGVLRLESHGLQVYNASTGDVLLDSLVEPPRVMPGPPDLEERALLWDRATLQEARWRTASGRPLLFSVRVDALQGEARRPHLLVRSAIADREVTSFEAPCCSASLAVAPRGPDEVLVILTQTRATDASPGRGRVELIRWAGESFEAVAHWEGRNDETPPAWVRDPNARP